MDFSLILKGKSSKYSTQIDQGAQQVEMISRLKNQR